MSDIVSVAGRDLLRENSLDEDEQDDQLLG